MILLLDIGNTRIKWRLSTAQAVLEQGAYLRESEPALPELTTAVAPQQVWVASVAGDTFEQALAAQTRARWAVEPWFARSSASAAGLTNSYAEPERMGVDRWLAMLAAWRQASGAVCVVQAGSALTIDFVAASGEHCGGYILPGLDSMQRALLNDTDRVRFASATAQTLEPGRSTADAVHRGLLLSQVGAVALALERMAHTGAVVFAGGNGESLAAALDREDAVLVPALVLDGLHLLAVAEGRLSEVPT